MTRYRHRIGRRGHRSKNEVGLALALVDQWSGGQPFHKASGSVGGM
jgi:hypothetical protein